jgi:hypothetical protein
MSAPSPSIALVWKQAPGDTASAISASTDTAVICDGHDTHGPLLSHHAAELLGAATGSLASLAATLFRDTDRALRDRLLAASPTYRIGPAGVIYSGPDDSAPVRGGTTASLLRINPTDGTIHFAHVGDSEGRYWDFADDTPPTTATLCAPDPHRILGDFHRKPDHATPVPTCQTIAPTASVRRRVVVVATRRFWNRVILPELTRLIAESVAASAPPERMLLRLRQLTMHSASIALAVICWP